MTLKPTEYMHQLLLWGTRCYIRKKQSCSGWSTVNDKIPLNQSVGKYDPELHDYFKGEPGSLQ